jgi:hypothetical protein
MEEKKLLSIEEIEAQTALELPDRPLMQVVPQVNTVTLVLSLVNLALHWISVVKNVSQKQPCINSLIRMYRCI